MARSSSAIDSDDSGSLERVFGRGAGSTIHDVERQTSNVRVLI